MNMSGRIRRLYKLGFSWKERSTGGKIVELYIVLLLAFYTLFMFKGDFAGIRIKTALFYTITVVTAMSYLILALEKKARLQKPETLYEYGLLLFGVANFLEILIKLFGNGGDYEHNLLNISLIICFYLLSGCSTFHSYYADVFLISGTLVFIGLAVRCFGNQEFLKPIELLVENSHIEVSYILLITSVSVLKYCNKTNKIISYYYLILSGFGFLLLSINADILGIYLMAGIFIVIPLVFPPTIYLIRQNMKVCFLYFFVLSNIGLVINYTNFIKKEITSDIMNSIYLSLLSAAMGIIFFSFWERLPQGKGTEELELPIIRKIFWRLLAAWGIFMGLAPIAGSKLETMQQHIGVHFIQQLMQNLQVCYQMENGYFFDVLQEFGLLGLILAILICSSAGKSILIEKAENNTDYMLKIIGFLFLTQLLFFGINPISSPIYVLFTTYALCGRRGGAV